VKRLDTQPGCCFDVFKSVIDKERMVGFYAQERQTDLLDCRVGLSDSDLARDHNYVEPAL